MEILILITILLKFVPNGPINNILALLQIITRRRPGSKPLFEPVMIRSPMLICSTQPQWYKTIQHVNLMVNSLRPHICISKLTIIIPPILDSPCPSVRPSVCPSVRRRHGFRSISQVCFGISISNLLCMLMVAIGRSLLIFSDVTFKMAAWRPYWIFWFPDYNLTLDLNINFKLQRHNTYVYG